MRKENIAALPVPGVRVRSGFSYRLQTGTHWMGLVLPGQLRRPVLSQTGLPAIAADVKAFPKRPLAGKLPKKYIKLDGFALSMYFANLKKSVNPAVRLTLVPSFCSAAASYSRLTPISGIDSLLLFIHCSCFTTASYCKLPKVASTGRAAWTVASAGECSFLMRPYGTPDQVPFCKGEPRGLHPVDSPGRAVMLRQPPPPFCQGERGPI